MSKNCDNCVWNDSGICNRKGIAVKKDGYCGKWKDKKITGWKEAFLRTFLAGH